MTDRNKTLVYLENHKVLGELLSTELANRYGYQILYRTERGCDFLRRKDSFSPDILLVSLNLSDISAFDLIYRLRQEGFSSPIIIMNHGSTWRNLESFFELGVAAVIDGEDSIDQIHQILQDPETGNKDRMGFNWTLSPQEERVLSLSGEGLTSREVAEILKNQTSTVSTLKRRMYKKTRTKNMVQLIAESRAW